jgi:hypothetical protein
MDNEMGRACSTNGGKEECIYRILVGKPEGKGPIGRPSHRWEDHREIGWGGMDWIDLA